MDIIWIISPTVLTRGNFIVMKRFLFLRATVFPALTSFQKYSLLYTWKHYALFYCKGLKKDNTLHVFSCETQLLL